MAYTCTANPLMCGSIMIYYQVYTTQHGLEIGSHDVRINRQSCVFILYYFCPSLWVRTSSVIGNWSLLVYIVNIYTIRVTLLTQGVKKFQEEPIYCM